MSFLSRIFPSTTKGPPNPRPHPKPRSEYLGRHLPRINPTAKMPAVKPPKRLVDDVSEETEALVSSLPLHQKKIFNNFMAIFLMAKKESRTVHNVSRLLAETMSEYSPIDEESDR